MVTWTASEIGGGAETINGYVIEWKSENDNGDITERNKCCEYLLKNRKSNTHYFVTVAARTLRGYKGMMSQTRDAVTRKLYEALSKRIFLFVSKSL